MVSNYLAGTVVKKASGMWRDTLGGSSMGEAYGMLGRGQCNTRVLWKLGMLDWRIPLLLKQVPLGL